MIRVGWGRADPVFRRVFTTRFIPGATELQMRWFDELQRLSMAPDMALASSRARSTVDVDALAPGVTARTLVLHADGDRAVPFEGGPSPCRDCPRRSICAAPWPEPSPPLG